MRNKLKILFIIFYGLLINDLNSQVIVRGKITTSNNQPISGALITFVDLKDTTYKNATLTDASGNYTLSLLTSIKNNYSLPTDFELEQNYPNPFSTSTSIKYKIKKQADVKITVYDILGREVKKFNLSNQSPGIHGIIWDARNEGGKKLSAGVYFYQMQIDNKSITKKMLVGFNSNISIPNYSVSNFNQLINENLLKGSYQVRIENGSRTSPTIIPKRFENITITKDTVLNYTVDKISPVTTINFVKLKQIIRGYGASSVLLWRPDMTDSEIQSAFGLGEGEIGFSIFRIMVEADSNRWGLYLPSVKKAQSMGATIIASPWYAPTNITEKVNNISRVKYDKYGEYAAHLNAFISFMKRNGVKIYGLSVQNEPDITDNWTSWTPNEMFNFMKNYAHLIKDTYVMAPESFQFRRNMSDPILNDSVACENTDIVCGHIYGGGLATYPLALSKGKEVWMTEYLFGEQNSANNWSWAIKLATNITDVMKADMSAYVWWYIVRYYGPIGDGNVAAQNPNDNYPKKGEVTKKGFVMSQFSKFIRPGFYRVETNISPTLIGDGVDVTAYKDPLTNKVVIVAVNTNSVSEEHTFKIQNSNVNSFTTYTTSSSKNCQKGITVNVVNNTFTYTMEPSSITTFVSN